MLTHTFWNRYFKVYDVLNYVIPYQELLKEIVKEVEVKEGDLILDAGVGTGNLALVLNKI
jgi:ubiquinone/menaquinone biosynthesis C-methylase UbiE